MKKTVLLLLVLFACWTGAKAQLPNGSIAPDFSTTDIDGGNHSLYGMLDDGKTVFLDFFATWCGPCWAYHNSHAFKNVWDSYGPPGTNEAFCLAIEGDASTNVACIYGPSGCVGGTQGDWTAGTPYPICDDASVAGMYSIAFYPTIYCVCPNHKVYQCGQLPAGSLWNFRNNTCIPPAIVLTVASIDNVDCFGTSTGAVDLVVAGGEAPFTYQWSNGMTTEDISNVPAGTYSVTVSCLGRQTIKNNIQVLNPPSVLNGSITGYTPIGCTVPGQISATGTGGWGNYTYEWSDGQDGQSIEVLSPGLYTVSIIDNEGCVKTATQNVGTSAPPVAAVAQPGILSCIIPQQQLDGTGSTQTGDISYLWNATNGGNIVSGGTTMTPTVNAAGNYTIRVTDNTTGCFSLKTVVVNANVALPNAEAGPTGSVTCAAPAINLQGSGSTGTNITYLWTAFNGGNIQSGSGTLTPTVNAGGSYILKVTNTDNGCAKNDTTTVAANNIPPTVAVTAGTLTCAVPNLNLNTTTNAAPPAFAWTGPNGWTSSDQNPTVGASGQYAVVVTDQTTGCTGTQSATVNENFNTPGANANGGTITCTTSSVEMNGSSPSSNVTYNWTGPNGFTSNLQNPTTSTSGQYNLVVTWGDNGCQSSATANVALNTTAPNAAAATTGNLNCNNSQIQLNGTASSQGNNFVYNWTASNGGNIVSGENTLAPVVNAAGTYTISVLNNDNGCTNTASVTQAQSTAVQANIGSQNNVLCNGGSNGEATALGAGGNGTYTYAWSNGATTATINGLVAGTYAVSVTDGENCTAATTVTISQPNPLACNASATAQTQNGVNDGTATAAPTGGTANYSYAWSNGETTQTISGLAPGSYTVNVTDANGCVETQTVTVNSYNCSLSTSIAGTNVSCFGANDGAAAVSMQGAADPVTYNWSNGATTQSVSGLAPGNYVVNIEDANGCPAQLSVDISEPTQVLSNATATGETAQGANDGTATATPTGGSGTYNYVWSNGQTTQTISNLAPGTYSVVVTDQNGCSHTQSVVVTGAGCALQTDLAVANVSCNGGSNGQITALVLGGTGNLSYLWSNGQTTATATGLAAGSYSVQITDEAGCQTTQNATVNQPAAVSMELLSQNNVVCPNDETGSATVAAQGGTGNFSYLWNNGQTGATATGLNAGTYTVVAADANNCQQTLQVQITANDPIAPSVSLSPGTVALAANGTATVTLANLNAILNDNCSVANHTISPATFNCSQIGTQTVEVTVFDASGNSASASTTVEVVDNLAPTVNCPASITKCYDENNVQYDAPTATDNCTGIGQWNLTAGLPSGSAFPVGVTTQTYTYTDASGNTGSCSFDVIIISASTVGSFATDGCFQACEGSVTALGVSGGLAPHSFVWSNGQTGQTVTGLCDGTIGLQIVDEAGCRTTQNFVITVPPAMAISGYTVVNDFNNQGVGSIDMHFSGGVAPYTYTWTNSGGQIVGTTEDIQNLVADTYSVIVKDANGCVVASQEGVVVQNTVGAVEPSWSRGMKLVPNPTSGLVQLRFAEMPNAEMQIGILDATGRLLHTIFSNGEQVVELDLSHLPEGMYSLRLRLEQEVSVKKVVVSH